MDVMDDLDPRTLDDWDRRLIEAIADTVDEDGWTTAAIVAHHLGAMTGHAAGTSLKALERRDWVEQWRADWRHPWSWSLTEDVAEWLENQRSAVFISYDDPA